MFSLRLGKAVKRAFVASFFFLSLSYKKLPTSSSSFINNLLILNLLALLVEKLCKTAENDLRP